VVIYNQFPSSNEDPNKRKQNLGKHGVVPFPPAETPTQTSALSMNNTTSSNLREAHRLAGLLAGSLSPNAAG
jgi:uncharacterized DUF497 family protein